MTLVASGGRTATKSHGADGDDYSQQDCYFDDVTGTTTTHDDVWTGMVTDHTARRG